jgi:hypothetical protein
VLAVLQGADDPPTTQAGAAAADRQKQFAAVKARWQALLKNELPALNARLKAAGLGELKIAAARLGDHRQNALGDDDDDVPATQRP